MRYVYLTFLQLLGLSYQPRDCANRPFWYQPRWRVVNATYAQQWHTFYVQTSEGSDTCDCFRRQCRGSSKGLHCENTWEHRHAVDTCSGARVSFFLIFRPDQPVFGQWWPGDSEQSLMVPSHHFAPRWNRSSFYAVARELFPLLRPTHIMMNIGHHLGGHLRTVRGQLSVTGLDTANLLQMYERVHKSLAVAKPHRMIWVGTIQPADDPGPSTSDEVALVSSVFEEVFNTSRYSHKWTRGSDFADAYHVELHGNILIAEGLMRQIYPYDTEMHATLAQRATSLRRKCVPYYYAG